MIETIERLRAFIASQDDTPQQDAAWDSLNKLEADLAAARAEIARLQDENRGLRAEFDSELAAARALLGEITIRLGDNDEEIESLRLRITDWLAGKDAT